MRHFYPTTPFVTIINTSSSVGSFSAKERTRIPWAIIRANSPVNCYATNLDADYGVDANVWLRSPEIDLSTVATAATLSFWQLVRPQI